MQCPTCGSAIAPGDAFCPNCGADVSAASQAPPPSPATPSQHVAPAVTQPLPSPEPPPFPGAPQPTQPLPTQPFPAQPGVQPPLQPGAKKPGLSGGAIAGIIVAVVVVLILGGVGSVLALRGLLAERPDPQAIVTTPKPIAPVTPPVSTEATESTEESSASTTSGSTTSDGSTTSGSSDSAADAKTEGDTVVTDAEARAVVKKFMDLRVAHKIAASKAYCTRKMLIGENGQFINDIYWRPDSYKIKKTTPDLMYIHVAVMGMWPSGNEPTIYSVFRDPKTGKVLIDDMIDPEHSPELWK